MSDLIKRTNKARRFPTNTCPASRHAARIGEALVRGKPYPMLTEESAHCGESILSAVASLWEARTEVERLTAALRHEVDCVEAAKAEIERLTAERDELRRQLAEAELDARRYRFIRDADRSDAFMPIESILCYSMDSLDAAIDAAMGGGDAG